MRQLSNEHLTGLLCGLDRTEWVRSQRISADSKGAGAAAAAVLEEVAVLTGVVQLAAIAQGLEEL